VLDIPGAGPPRDETTTASNGRCCWLFLFQLFPACPVGSSSPFTVVSGHSFLVPLGSKTAPLTTRTVGGRVAVTSRAFHQHPLSWSCLTQGGAPAGKGASPVTLIPGGQSVAARDTLRQAEAAATKGGFCLRKFGSWSETTREEARWNS
jgi:hypothetical protein